MKILQIVCYFYHAWAYGGPPQSLFGLCRELVKRGHEVTVYTTDALDANHRVKELKETVDGIEIRRFRNISNYLAWNHRIFLTPGMIAAVRDNIKNFDIVHLNDFRTLQNLLAHHYARQYNIPYVLQARGSLINVISKKRLKQLFDIIGGYRLLRDASRFIALVPPEVDKYKEMGVSANKIDLIPNGVDPALYENLPKRGSFKQKYGLTDKNQVVLYLGRLHKIKGIDLLIQAFAGLTKEFSNARLVIAGPDDGYLPTLKNLTKKLGLDDRVLFVGGLYGEDKLAAYVDADVYALISVFGTTILEAMSCGTPVVVSEDCSMVDVIKNKAGLVVPYEIDSIRKALFTLLADDKMRQQFGQNCRVLVKEKYGWGAIAEQVEAVYNKCLGK
jgi:glycosyltransferase involved in cell wall biosynthesis